MSKTKLEINKAEFQLIVNNLEKTTNFTKLSELWKAVEDSSWAKSRVPRPLTAAVAMVRAKELQIVTKTQPGKRGNASLGTLSNKGTRIKRADKLVTFAPSFDAMRKSFPVLSLPVIQKAQNGSIKAAVKLKCYDCSGFQKVEIKNCTVFSCPLYPIRPYQQEIK